MQLVLDYLLSTHMNFAPNKISEYFAGICQPVTESFGESNICNGGSSLRLFFIISKSSRYYYFLTDII